MLHFRNRWRLATIGLALALVLLAGCGPAAAPTQPETKPGEPAAKPGPPDEMNPITGKMTGDPKYGGVYRTFQPGSAIAPHLDPQQTVTYAVHRVGAGIVFSRLFQFKTWADSDLKSGVIENDLAESWKLLPDNVTYEIKLRPGVKWQNIPPLNGRELTADDVIFSLKRQATPGFANAAQVTDIVSMEAVDKSTLRLTTKAPNAGFIMNLADGHTKIIPKEVVEQKGDLRNGPLIGTGPWILEDGWNRSVGYKFRKNPDYFKKDPKGRPLPYLDGLEIVIMGDNAAIIAAMRTGQLSEVWAFLQPAEIEDLHKGKPELVMDRRPGIGSFSGVAQHMGIKSQTPPFNDVRVRQAFSKALNRQELVDTVLNGKGILTMKLQLPSEDWHIPLNELKEYWKQDIEGAKKLLAEAGYPNGLDMELTTKVDPQQSAIGELIVAQVAKAGFRAKIKPIDNPTYADAVLTSGKYQVYNGTGLSSSDPNIDLYRFYHSKSLSGNTAGVNDPKLDEMIDKQRSEFDPEKRKAILKEIQWYIVKNAWYFQLFQALPSVLRIPNVRNYNQGCCYDHSHWEHIWLEK